jgi:WD40 repeat protein
MTLLPTEVLVHIISMVPIHDILLSLCTVNKTFREIIHLNSLWHNLYDIYWKKVKIPPIPRCNDGSGKDWRGVVVQKYRIENNWKRGRHSTVTIGDGVMVSCLDFMNTTLATGSPDKVVRLWDMKDGSCLRSMSGHFGGVECLQLDFPRGRVVTGSRDGNIKIWDITRPIGEELVMTLNHDMSYVTCLQIQDSMLISGVGSGNIFVWDLNTGTCINRIQGHNKIVSTLQFRGKQLISGSRDKSIKVWDLTGNLNTGTLLSEVSVEKIQWKDDLLMNIEETAISAYSVSLLGRHSSYDGHNHWVRGFQFKKNMLVSASEDIKVWSVKDKKIECALTDHLAFVNCFKFDDQKLVSSSSDRKVRISNFS